jgi:hypothetical protein
VKAASAMAESPNSMDVLWPSDWLRLTLIGETSKEFHVIDPRT